jgi:hypothetical protein
MLPVLQVVASGQQQQQQEGQGGRASRSFPALLLAQLGGPVLAAYLRGSQQAGHCVRVVAAVLVNLTHQNDAGGWRPCAAGCRRCRALRCPGLQELATSACRSWPLTCPSSLCGRSAAGNAALTQAGALATTAGVLAVACGELGPRAAAAAAPSASASSSGAAMRSALVARHEVLSVVLGLLINLVATHPANQKALAVLEVQLPGPEAPGPAQQQAVRLVPLLCDVLNLLDGPAAATSSGGGAAAGGAAAGVGLGSPAAPGRPVKTFGRASGGGSPGGAPPGAGEVTEAELHQEEGHGVASILEM